MASDSNQDDDWGLGSAISSAKTAADDGPGVNVVSNSGLSAGASAKKPAAGELRYVTLLNAAVDMVKTGKLSMEEYTAGVKKLDVICDNALKLYNIPALKKDIPSKMDENQLLILNGLEAETRNMKAGLTRLLAYPESRSSADLEEGHKQAVDAMWAIDRIQKKADAEKARLDQKHKEEKAKRAQKAAGAAEES